MAKNLAQVLKADISRLPLRKAAEALRKKGRGRDTVLAHITPDEAALLKARGGSGTINPDTGLPEFEDGFFPTFDFGGGFGGGDIGGNVGTVDVPTPPARPSDYELAQYNPNTYGAGLGEYTPTAALSNIVPGVDQGVQAMEIAGVDPATLRYGIDPMAKFLATTAGTQDFNIPTPPAMPADIAAARAQYLADTGVGDREYVTPPGIDKETMDRMAAAEAAKGKGIDTPFGRLGLKEAIAALGLGGMGLNYLNAQAQGKKAAAQLKAAYDQAAAQSRELAQPYMQQGGQQLGQALTGALSPAQQQQLAAAQAQAAQATASSGGVAAAQAGRSVEDLRQRLLATQQTMALQLLGSGTPLISQAIRDQLAGTTTGINTNLQMSQQAGQAAGNMLAMLGAMYARG
jgi:hypothetical protein